MIFVYGLFKKRYANQDNIFTPVFKAASSIRKYGIYFDESMRNTEYAGLDIQG